ncbi:MAG TPA: hypothetical protein V6D22_08260 [Candidatus Obscuribacterales bacterium]
MLQRKNSLGIALTLLLVAGYLPADAWHPPYTMAAAIAADSIVLNDANASKEIGPLEKRFFAREYAHDPVEKRLERLELLVFGSTQDGSNNDRYSRLKKAIVARQAESAKTASGKGDAAHRSGTQTSKVPASSAQYTALKTLEWRAFKKTYPNDSLDQRLDRLETKAFGAPNKAMAYVDRVDRLKRTLGIDVAPQTAITPRSMPLGPAPKAHPRGEGGDDFFGFGQPPMIGAQPFDDEDGLGGMSPMPLNNTMQRMMREMNRQMRQLEQMQPGAGVPMQPGIHSYSFSFELDPKTGKWIDKNTGKPVDPRSGGRGPTGPGAPFSTVQPPTFKSPSIQPKSMPFPLQRDTNELPPYSDPNSI